jgi:shikimate dehydrogenase
MDGGLVADTQPVMSSSRKVLFVGVDTSGSAAHRLFPMWLAALGVNAELVGVDLPLNCGRERYRRLIAELAGDDEVLGAVVTSHKLSLFDACVDLFCDIDRYAAIAHETNCLWKQGHRLGAGARDPLALAAVFSEMIPPSYWRDHAGEVLCLGAGGAATAIAITFFAEQRRQPDFSSPPVHIVFADVSQKRLNALQRTVDRIGAGGAAQYLLVRDQSVADDALHRLPPHSLVINATGLGKDVPGSPLSGAVAFPLDGLVWDLNYRGELQFLKQARRQKHEQRLHVHDGWRYFLHGWFQALSAILRWSDNAENFGLFAAAAQRFPLGASSAAGDTSSVPDTHEVATIERETK